MDVTNKCGKVNTVKIDKDIFRRLLSASASGRDINISTIVKHELAPVPTSLATLDRNLRKADKAPLLNILSSGHVELIINGIQCHR